MPLYNGHKHPLVLVVDDVVFEISIKYLFKILNFSNVAIIPPKSDCFHEPLFMQQSYGSIISKCKEVFSRGVDSVSFVL